MNDICGINMISPFQGLGCWGDLRRRALPYANDFGLSAHNHLINNKIKTNYNF